MTIRPNIKGVILGISKHDDIGGDIKLAQYIQKHGEIGRYIVVEKMSSHQRGQHKKGFCEGLVFSAMVIFWPYCKNISGLWFCYSGPAHFSFSLATGVIWSSLLVNSTTFIDYCFLCIRHSQLSLLSYLLGKTRPTTTWSGCTW